MSAERKNLIFRISSIPGDFIARIIFHIAYTQVESIPVPRGAYFISKVFHAVL